MSRDKAKDKHRERVNAKMDKAVRAAEIYNGIYEQQKKAERRHHRHATAATKAERRENQIKKVKELLIQSVVAPWMYAVIVTVIVAILTSPLLGMFAGFCEENYTSETPEFISVNEVTETFTGSDVKDGYITLSNITAPAINENYAEITCKLAGLDHTKIFFGESLSGLSQGVVQIEDSALPGEGKLIKLYGYSATVFGGLKKFAKDDEINLTTNYGTFTYKVEKCTEVASDNQDSVYSDLGDNEYLVMYTETSSGILDEPSENMYYVLAKKVSGPFLMQ